MNVGGVCCDGFMRDQLPQVLAEQHREALAAGVSAVEAIETMIRRLDYLRASQLAGLSRLGSQIAADEGHPDHGETVHRAIEAEVAAALRTGHVSAANLMAHAGELIDRYPATAAELAEGRVSLPHTRVVAEAGRIIVDARARAAYEAEALPLALELTPRQLRAHARRIAEHFAECSLEERHREARARRGVRVVDLDDGMADVIATVGAVEAYAIKDRLARIAYAARRASLVAGDPAASSGADACTPRQAQADAFVGLLLTGAPGFGRDDAAFVAGDPLDSITARVQVSVPVLTLAGATGPGAQPHLGPAELAGYGPIDAPTARRLAGAAPAWERVLTHPISGAVLAVDRYRPSEDLRRLLGACDQHCRFLGCTRRLDHCDVDHTIPAAEGGPTSPENTGHLCRRHHTLKHFEFLRGSGWKAKQEAGGVYEWTAPSGRRYRDAPSSSVRFRPVPGPEQPP